MHGYVHNDGTQAVCIQRMACTACLAGFGAWVNPMRLKILESIFGRAWTRNTVKTRNQSSVLIWVGGTAKGIHDGEGPGRGYMGPSARGDTSKLTA